MRIYIKQDCDPPDPREDFDYLGTMACWHKRHNLGDEQIEDPKEWFDELDERTIYLPLYIYEHSGITMRTTPFSCRWDSGQVGWIYVTHENCVKEFGENYDVAHIEKILKCEVEEYDQYLQGDIWGFEIVDDDGELIDSCYGFYGDEIEKTGILDHILSIYHDQAKEAWERRFE